MTAFDYGGSGRILTKNGPGTLILTQSANNPGLLQLNGGTVDFRAGVGTGNGVFSVAGTNAAAVVTNSTGTMQTIQFGRQGTRTSSFAGSIKGNLNIVNGQTGEGGITQTFTSTSAHTYTGTTTLNRGSWILNGTHTGGGNYAVNSGTSDGAHATLGGAGTIVLANSTRTFSFTGNTAARNAILRPGASGTDTATLTLGSAAINTAVNLNNNSVLRVDIGAASASDRVAIFGDLNLAAGSTLDLLALSGAFDGSGYTVATFTGTLSGTFGTVTGLDPLYQINYNPSSITLTLIPEPGTLMLAAMGAAMLLPRRKRMLNT